MKSRLFVLFLLILTTKILCQDYYPVKVGYNWVYQSVKADGKLGNFFKTISILDRYKDDEAFVVQHKLFVGEKETSQTVEGLLFRDGRWVGIYKNDKGKNITTVEFQIPSKKNNAWLLKDNDEEREDCTVIGKTDLEMDGIRYTNVLKVKREITLKIGVPDGLLKKLVYYDYYAPNIGLIQTESVIEDKPTLILILKEFNKN